MPFTRREVIGGIGASVLGSTANALAKRNFVFIVIDDLLSVVYARRRYGTRIIAPNLYRLMDEGVSFTNAFASTALCNPSRTSILSGMNPFKTGVHDNQTAWPSKIDINKTFPAIMAAAGWRCFMYGKIGHGSHGLWETSGICEEVQIFKPAGVSKADKDAATASIARIRTDLRKPGASPWLLMVGLEGPHLPFGDVPELLNRYPLSQIAPVDWSGDPPSSCIGDVYDIIHQDFLALEQNGTVKQYIQGYLADVTAMDRQLGRLLTSLDQSGLDPIIILSSDHGFMLGEHDVVTKFTLWDEAARAPLIFRYPGCPAGTRITQTVSLLDIGPSFLHKAGLTIPPHMDGESLFPLINNPSIKRTSGAMTTVYESVSFRSNRYRLSRYSPCGDLELYDQLLDPESRTNEINNPGYTAVRSAMITSLDVMYARWTS